MNAHMLKAGYPEGIGSKYFWRDGRPMPFRWYMRKVEDAAYKVVAKSYPTEAIEVSTVWLGLDHGFSFHSKGPQQIFESMVFGGPMHNEQWRYSTEDEARRGHVELLDKVITALSEVSA